MEGITTAVLDEFPHLRLNPLHKAMFLGALCFCFYLMGLLLVTDVSGFFFFFFASERGARLTDCISSALTWSHSLCRLCPYRVGFTGSLSLTPSALVSASSSSPSSCALASPSSMVAHLTPFTLTWNLLASHHSLTRHVVKSISNPVSILRIRRCRTVFLLCPVVPMILLVPYMLF